jgi:hypothetical protein
MGVLSKPLMQALGQKPEACEPPRAGLEGTISRNSLLGRLKATQGKEMSPLVPMSPRASKQQLKPGSAAAAGGGGGSGGDKAWEQAEAEELRPQRKLQFVARTPKNSVFGVL